MFRKMPVILCGVILLVMLLEPLLPLEYKQALYGLSLSLKSVILFLLPFIIFGLLFKVASTLSGKATRLFGIVLALVVLSNFISTLLSHFAGKGIYTLPLSLTPPQELSALTPSWVLEIPKVVSNDVAMFSAIALGLVLSLVRPAFAKSLSSFMDRVVTKIFSFFAVMIPLFVAGFVMKLQHDGVIALCLKQYTAVFCFVAIAQFSYIGAVYFLIAKAKRSEWLISIKNMLPAAISGLSTMSSAASMPLTIMGVEKNTQSPDIARSVIPMTVNIHLVGDCFAIPIFAYAVMKSFGCVEPAMIDFLLFACFFVLAKFSVAAVPGGGILVMLPVLEAHLGFTGEMLSLITALYILFDPFITCANILGNGAFAKLVSKISLSPFRES